jgi:hypothetical protein
MDAKTRSNWKRLYLEVVLLYKWLARLRSSCIIHVLLLQPAGQGLRRSDASRLLSRSPRSSGSLRCLKVALTWPRSGRLRSSGHTQLGITRRRGRCTSQGAPVLILHNLVLALQHSDLILTPTSNFKNRNTVLKVKVRALKL